MDHLRIATRNSPLALWQAELVKNKLVAAHPELNVVLVPMTTRGDQLLDRSLSKVGGKGLFLKELELSLPNKQTDIAVHSMKDVPNELPNGLELAAFLERGEPRDAFVSNKYPNLYALPQGARLGTSSLRRVALVKNAFPNLEFSDLRGNVNTRLAKLDAGDYDAIILAAAGLERLGFEERISQYISPELCLPAVGQGIIGVECRVDDLATKALLEPLQSKKDAVVLAAERSMNAILQGGCQVPIAGHATIEKGRVHLRGAVAHPDGSVVLRSQSDTSTVSVAAALKLGEDVANDLLDQGAGGILEALKHRQVNQAPTLKPLILLTRQLRFLGNTLDILKRLDYDVAHVPTITVSPKNDSQLLERFSNLADYTDVVFVSRNAVDIGMSMIEQQGGIPEHVRVLTVGSQSAKQLYGYGVDASFPNAGRGAEALLKVSQLTDMTNRHVLWVRGSHGLRWPQQTLRERGAQVDEAICYEQTTPEDCALQLDRALADGRPLETIFIHSGSSLTNLMSVAGDHIEQLSRARLVLGSNNMARAARKLNWKGDILVADSPSNKHMMMAFAKS